jgi:hypothetical protein
VRYVSHQFAHLETLERAKRWLVQAGFDPNRIEARTQGALSLAIGVNAGEWAEAQRIIDAAESSDPDGSPGIWYQASHDHVCPEAGITPGTTASTTQSESFVVGWRPLDAHREVTQTDTEVELQKHYREDKD